MKKDKLAKRDNKKVIQSKELKKVSGGGSTFAPIEPANPPMGGILAPLQGNAVRRKK
jgi:hypothetical protein